MARTAEVDGITIEQLIEVADLHLVAADCINIAYQVKTSVPSEARTKNMKVTQRKPTKEGCTVRIANIKDDLYSLIGTTMSAPIAKPMNSIGRGMYSFPVAVIAMRIMKGIINKATFHQMGTFGYCRMS